MNWFLGGFCWIVYQLLKSKFELVSWRFFDCVPTFEEQI